MASGSPPTSRELEARLLDDDGHLTLQEDRVSEAHCRLRQRLENIDVPKVSRPPTRDDLLDNITLYWLTGTGVSAACLY
jgi:hypothetical protein